jgi:hypothetical protein
VRTLPALIPTALLVLGCAEDRILPVASVCGDGVVAGDEQCDTSGPGCVACKITAGWDCPDDVCAPICGDGKVVGDEQCDPPNGTTCDSVCGVPQHLTGCNLTGYFAVHQTDYSLDTIVSTVQTSSNWYLYHFTQSGSEFAVDSALFCGLFVSGTVDVSIDDRALTSLIYSNRQDAKGAHGARRGHFTPSDGGAACNFDFERWYLVRGVDESTYLPKDFTSKPALSDLPPLPRVADPLTPAATVPGATDPDGDGLPGLALHLTGNIQGLRSVGQRDWNEYSTDPSKPIPPGSAEFRAVSTFESQESVFSATQCQPALCSLLVAGATPDRTHPGWVAFRYLGKNIGDPQVAAIAKGEPGADPATDVETCKQVQAAMPHEPYKP